MAVGWAEAELTALAQKGLRRQLEPLESAQGPVVRVGGRTLVNFSSNDYLGLAAAPDLAAAAAAALSAGGTGAGASRLLVGDTLEHRRLEEELAAFEGTEAAVLFNSGYAANVGVLSALLGPEDVVFSDALNHASIVDGCRLSRARIVIYPHSDADALGQLLTAHTGRRRLVVTDSVFSMDGDLAPLTRIAALCREHGAALMVDEAHATGVLGPGGAGLVEQLGLQEQVELRMGTLGKALGAYGAYIACARPLAELLVNRARSLVFSTALPPAVCAAASAAVKRVRADGALRERLWRHIHRFASGLSALGFPAEPRSAVFPVVVGAPEAALEASAFLRERGLLVKAIRPPTVPQGTSRLRFSLSASHTEAHVDAALRALEEWSRGRRA
ncbi:MAG: 8-amino-7-oxononanoate synthase [Myxococcaceae bacterium]|nr:8-amino-7-oxononanoate synthase [Myxococcaceae bacterium]